MLADLEAFGAPEEIVDEWEQQDKCFDVWPENWESLLAFLACSTQWSYSPMGTVLGLRYEGVAAALELSETRAKPQVFEDIRILEHAALEVFRERERRK